MRDKIVAGNWKMNLNYEDAIHLATNLNAWVADNHPIAQVIIAPSSLYLQTLLEGVDEQYIKISSQDISAHEKGAYTGDISAEQLDSIGLDFAIIGHSERREYQGETNIDIADKLKQAFKYQINPILCVGEKLEEREAEKHFEVVKTQIMDALVAQKPEDLSRLIIAYEPVWAIGTGKTATDDQANEVCTFIRKTIADLFGQEAADTVRIQYGGSVKPATISNLMAKSDIDGALVGGASLKAEDFSQIVKF